MNPNIYLNISNVPANSVLGNSSNLIGSCIALPTGITYSNLSTLGNVTDNSTTLQPLVNAYVANMTAKSSTQGFAPIVTPYGSYKFTTGITSRPWIKFVTSGQVTFDFTGLSNSGTAFRVHNQDAPPSNTSANITGISCATDWSAFLEGSGGAFFIIGPSSGQTSAITTLNGTINSTTTTIVVTNGALLPSSGNYQILVNLEAMLVTGGQGTNTLTVSRNQNGTIAQSHTTLSAINQLYTNIGLDLGDISSTSTSGQFDVRNTSIVNTVFKNFATGILLRETNTYFVNFESGGYIFGTGYSVVTEIGSGANSGERDSFRNWTFAGGINGYVCNTAGIEMLFDNSSFDFFKGSALYFDNNADFAPVYLNKCHVEHCEGGIAFSNIATLNGLVLKVDDLVYVASSDLTRGASPRQALFKGKMYLDVNGIQYGYTQPWNDATVGLFTCDSNVTVLEFKNVRWNAFSFFQLSSQKLLINEDPLFAQGTPGSDLVSSPMPTWTVTAHNAIAAVVDTTNPLTAYGGTQTIKFTCSGTGNFYVIQTNKIKVKAGDRLLSNTCFYGGSSAGTCAIQLQYIFTSSTGALPSVIDAGAFGDNMSTLYSDSGDPSWLAGNLRTYQVKGKTLRLGTVPAGYDQAQLSITIASMNSGDIIWLTFAGTCLN